LVGDEYAGLPVVQEVARLKTGYPVIRPDNHTRFSSKNIEPIRLELKTDRLNK
jgi:hypothetical protein